MAKPLNVRALACFHHFRTDLPSHSYSRDLTHRVIRDDLDQQLKRRSRSRSPPPERHRWARAPFRRRKRPPEKIETLPVELLFEIADYLDDVSLANLSRTSCLLCARVLPVLVRAGLSCPRKTVKLLSYALREDYPTLLRVLLSHNLDRRLLNAGLETVMFWSTFEPRSYTSLRLLLPHVDITTDDLSQAARSPSSDTLLAEFLPFTQQKEINTPSSQLLFDYPLLAAAECSQSPRSLSLLLQSGADSSVHSDTRRGFYSRVQYTSLKSNDTFGVVARAALSPHSPVEKLQVLKEARVPASPPNAFRTQNPIAAVVSRPITPGSTHSVWDVVSYLLDWGCVVDRTVVHCVSFGIRYFHPSVPPELITQILDAWDGEIDGALLRAAAQRYPKIICIDPPGRAVMELEFVKRASKRVIDDVSHSFQNQLLAWVRREQNVYREVWPTIPEAERGVVSGLNPWDVKSWCLCWRESLLALGDATGRRDEFENWCKEQGVTERDIEIEFSETRGIVAGGYCYPIVKRKRPAKWRRWIGKVQFWK